MISNNPPTLQWFAAPLACGTVRHRLYIGGRETPYFVDNARRAGQARYTFGEPIGLFAAGRGVEIRRRDGGTYRIAATLGSFRNVTAAKEKAESLVLRD